MLASVVSVKATLGGAGDELRTAHYAAPGGTIYKLNKPMEVYGETATGPYVVGGGDTIFAGAGNGTIVGQGSADTIVAGDGNDKIYGYHQTYVYTGSVDDQDSIDAGNGIDTVYGGPDNDTIWGGSGTDELWGNEFDDETMGGPGLRQGLGRVHPRAAAARAGRPSPVGRGRSPCTRRCARSSCQSRAAPSACSYAGGCSRGGASQTARGADRPDVTQAPMPHVRV